MADVAVGAASDTGSVRDHNEDAVRVWDEAGDHVQTNGRLFALADGMGGHSRGEVASAMALDVLFERYYREPVSDVAGALKRALMAANEQLYQDGAAKGPAEMMGTTLVAGVVHGNQLTVANVGDSRAYLLRGGQLVQVSRDHSVVAEQVRAGVITAEQARTARNRNVITRALGHQPRVEVDLFDIVPLFPADGVLLASDGLYHAFDEAELAVMALEGGPDEAAAALVRTARERNSSDNASAVIARYAREATTALPRLGTDLFDTARLPTEELEPVAAGGRRTPWLVPAAIILLVLVLLALAALLLLPQFLPGVLPVP